MKRTFVKAAGIGIVVLALALVGFVAACGEGDGTASPTDTPAAASPTDAPAAASGLQEAIDQIDAMVAAAEGGDLEAAEAAFEAGHDPLHEVIDSLETTDAALAAQLDEAAEDAEKDFEEAADAEHIVEIGQEIRDILRQVE
jgi:hypothetical protein